MQFVDIVSRKVLNVKLPTGKAGDPGSDIDAGDAAGAGGLRNN